MNQQQRSVLLHSASRSPLPLVVLWTAGFRADASQLESMVFHLGILAALRSIQTRSVIGLMITASHNKASDNGVKVADPFGEMLAQHWEPFADAIANSPYPYSLLQLLDDFVKEENITPESAPTAQTFLGRDTRPSGVSLVEAARQTGYANGASTDYLKQLGLEVVWTPTGVKYLHEKAAEYDIDIYFEANGHGTILFSDAFLFWLEIRNNELSSISKGLEQHKAALRLLAVSKLINQAVGDALSGLLLVEAILQHMDWSIHKWNALYQDLPSDNLRCSMDKTLLHFFRYRLSTGLLSLLKMQRLKLSALLVYKKLLMLKQEQKMW